MEVGLGQHNDEVRAFLEAPYKDKNWDFVKFRGGHQHFEIMKTLHHGLKTAHRDHQKEVATRLGLLGFVRLVICSCIYVLRNAENVIIVYGYVDDFILSWSSRLDIDEVISSFR